MLRPPRHITDDDDDDDNKDMIMVMIIMMIKIKSTSFCIGLHIYIAYTSVYGVILCSLCNYWFGVILLVSLCLLYFVCVV